MTLEITCNWLGRNPRPSADELEATLAAIRIRVGKENVTEHVPLGDLPRHLVAEQVAEKLHIPSYFLAEWIAENWWPMLFEPRKTEEASNLEYDGRHSVLVAQHGFPLPSLRIEPAGETVQISCSARDAILANIRFRNSASSIISRKTVEAVLSSFVQGCDDRLIACNIRGTPMQTAWQSVKETSREQRMFCELAGASGVNPYSASDVASAAIEYIYGLLGYEASLDLCMAASISDLSEHRMLLEAVATKLNELHSITLEPIVKVRVAQDGLTVPAWRRGKEAAIRVRTNLGISTNDQYGADKLLRELNIQPERAIYQNVESIAFSGAIDRVANDASIVLLQAQEESRRFAACRAIFLAMNSGEQSRRIITDAVTRDQQASRAFAAEILVPSEFLKARATGGRLSVASTYEIAKERRAGIEAIQRQAENNFLIIGDHI